jgi:hypothetical protein
MAKRGFFDGAREFSRRWGYVLTLSLPADPPHRICPESKAGRPPEPIVLIIPLIFSLPEPGALRYSWMRGPDSALRLARWRMVKSSKGKKIEA